MFKLAQGIFHNFKTKPEQTPVKKCFNFLSTTSNMIAQNLKNLNLNSNSLKPNNLNRVQLEQIRHGSFGYKGRMMLKDIKRRELLRKYAPERVRLQTLSYNWILPKFFRVKSFFV
jgi:gamma-glutamylcysteine synthetase